MKLLAKNIAGYRDLLINENDFDWYICYTCNLRYRFICKRVFGPEEIMPILKTKKVRVYSFLTNKKKFIAEQLAILEVNLLRYGEWDGIAFLKNGCTLCNCDSSICINKRLLKKRKICFCPKLFGINLDLKDNEGAILIRRETE